jgi:hypothetical protein
MKRRDVLLSLFGAATLGGVTAASTSARTAQRGRAPVLSPGAVDELMRAHGLEPQPGEAMQVRAFLLSTRARVSPDPRIEPALRLDPETN